MTRTNAINILNTHKSEEVWTDDIAKAIDMAIEALQEHKTGNWIDGSYRQTCSVCHYRGRRSWLFCPNCGASMRGEEDD